MKPVVFVAAEPREFSGYLKHCTRIKPLPLPVHWARAGECGGRTVWLVANGAGQDRAERAVEAALAAGEAECVVSTGLCGALDPALRVADVFVAERITSARLSVAGLLEAVQAEIDRYRLALRRPSATSKAASGTLFSAGRIVSSAVEKRRLHESGASVVEMEAAGAGAAACRHGVPFFCIRAVSDLAGETFANDLNRALRSDGRFDTIKILSSAMRQPATRLPELLRLRNRCALASAKLGDFLAGCRF